MRDRKLGIHALYEREHSMRYQVQESRTLLVLSPTVFSIVATALTSYGISTSLYFLERRLKVRTGRLQMTSLYNVVDL